MDRTRTPRRGRLLARVAALGYVAFAAVGGLLAGAADQPDSATAFLHLATFPGSVAVGIAAFASAALLDVEPSFSDADPGVFGVMLPFALGASLNVLLVWGAAAFGCRVAGELREHRRFRGRTRA
ncbi:hypothetical protein [Streptomyces genisteinicus]|uniref:Uncharacterized protein n=1 Tax=Streptomyces genisteinicus TaxID=2768068 RepID=A0A7H0I052_9ACTN|nr:hypothetical protein [Streptomyces genisteinicus]QNP66168.1 hypothetical protein IAG43_26725 [Streptomyces genisteinicus]